MLDTKQLRSWARTRWRWLVSGSDIIRASVCGRSKVSYCLIVLVLFALHVLLQYALLENATANNNSNDEDLTPGISINPVNPVSRLLQFVASSSRDRKSQMLLSNNNEPRTTTNRSKQYSSFEILDNIQKLKMDKIVHYDTVTTRKLIKDDNNNNLKQSSSVSDAQTVISPQRYRFNCSNIPRINIKRKVGHGVTKHVYLGLYDGERVAVKMVTRGVMDVTSCLKEKSTTHANASLRDRERCYVLPNMKLMKEILLLEQISHQNLAQLLGYCVRSEETDSTSLADHGVVAVYEYAQSFYVSSLSDWTPRRRLETASKLADLLDYLEHSPLGSLRIADFKAAHFLMTPSRKEIKLTDLDDVNSVEPTCGGRSVVSDDRINRDDLAVMRSSNNDTITSSNNNVIVRESDDRSGRERITTRAIVRDGCEYGLKCIGAICRGHNAKYNMDRMNRLFFQPLLLFDGDVKREEEEEEENEKEEKEEEEEVSQSELTTQDVNQVSQRHGTYRYRHTATSGDTLLSRFNVADKTRPRPRRPRRGGGREGWVRGLKDARTALNRHQLSAGQLKEVISALLKAPLSEAEIDG